MCACVDTPREALVDYNLSDDVHVFESTLSSTFLIIVKIVIIAILLDSLIGKANGEKHP